MSSSSLVAEAEQALRFDDRDLAQRLFTDVLATSASENERARALAGLGELAWRQSDPQSTIEYLELAFELFDDHLPERAAIADTLGRAYAFVNRHEDASSLLRRCLEQAEQEGNTREAVRFGCLLANVLMDLHRFGEAEELIGRSLAASAGTSDPTLLVRLHWTQARLHTLQRNFDPAERHARSALEILERSEETHWRGRANHLLAAIAMDRGDAAEALEFVQEARRLMGGGASPLEQASLRVQEARALAGLGEQEEAAAIAMDVAGRMAEFLPDDRARNYSLLGKIFEDLGDRARALELYELAVDSAEQLSNPTWALESYARLAELLETEGRKDEAFDVLKRASELQTATRRDSGQP